MGLSRSEEWAVVYQLGVGARASVINYLISTVFNQRSLRAPSVNIGQTSRGSRENGRGQRLVGAALARGQSGP